MCIYNTPSPYLLLSENKNTGFGASKRKSLDNADRMPGPGSYQIPTNIGKARSTVFKQSSMLSLWNGNNRTPGVGQYNLNDKYTRTKWEPASVR